MAEVAASHLSDAVHNTHGTIAMLARSSPKGGDQRRFFAVLHTERIDPPLPAVRAAIVAKTRAQNK